MVSNVTNEMHLPVERRGSNLSHLKSYGGFIVTGKRCFAADQPPTNSSNPVLEALKEKRTSYKPKPKLYCKSLCLSLFCPHHIIVIKKLILKMNSCIGETTTTVY